MTRRACLPTRVRCWRRVDLEHATVQVEPPENADDCQGQADW